MYADIVFRHERPANKLYCTSDYEDDVVTSAYHGEGLYNYESAFDITVKLPGTHGLPHLTLVWNYRPPGEYLYAWPELFDDLMSLAGWPDDLWRKNVVNRLALPT